MSRRGRGNRVRLADLGPEAQEQARAQLAAWRERDRPLRPEARELPPDPLEGATGLERRYAAWLDEEQLQGRVVAWRYEPMTLVLRRGKKGGKGLRYTPDFLVLQRGCCTCSETGRVRSVNAEGVVTRVSTCGACEGRTWSDLHQRTELVEVKPTKGESVLFLGDSRTKILAAAEAFRWAPWRLVLVWPAPGGWGRQVL